MSIDYHQYKHLFKDYSWSIDDEAPSWLIVERILLNCSANTSERLICLDKGCQKGMYSSKLLEVFGDRVGVIAYDLMLHPEMHKNALESGGRIIYRGRPAGNGKTITCTSAGLDFSLKTVKLDDDVPKLTKKPIAFIKIDVDGSQNEVVQGAQKLLANNTPFLMIELNTNLDTVPLTDIPELSILSDNDKYARALAFIKLNPWITPREAPHYCKNNEQYKDLRLFFSESIRNNPALLKKVISRRANETQKRDYELIASLEQLGYCFFSVRNGSNCFFAHVHNIKSAICK